MCLMLMLRKRLFTNGFSMRGTFLGSLVVELISLKVGRLLWTLVLSSPITIMKNGGDILTTDLL
ncbi:hypothetical protein HA466_0228790 [Hirschfeldia incana]|nr:hypothetical protein HA466_0228790 [Hirschfeldia incana]KAJ0240221.1 hypothetical protein HA466_0228790 [Hirschfeldia incana]